MLLISALVCVCLVTGYLNFEVFGPNNLLPVTWLFVLTLLASSREFLKSKLQGGFLGKFMATIWVIGIIFYVTVYYAGNT